MWLYFPTMLGPSSRNLPRYTSPNSDTPLKGMLAAVACNDLGQYVLNAVYRTPQTVKVQPPEEIVLPPLKRYTFIPVTGSIICRHATDVAGADQSSTQPKTSPAKVTPLKQARALSHRAPT